MEIRHIFFRPSNAATGVKVSRLGDLPACVGVLKSLITNKEELGDALNAGLATAVGAEILEALKYVDNENPYAEDSGMVLFRIRLFVPWVCRW